MIKNYYRENFDSEINQKHTTVFLRNENNKENSTITFHEIIPGIELTYNFFYGKSGAEAKSCSETQKMIEINHCRQGRSSIESK